MALVSPLRLGDTSLRQFRGMIAWKDSLSYVVGGGRLCHFGSQDTLAI